jgi:hypothetical protein
MGAPHLSTHHHMTYFPLKQLFSKLRKLKLLGARWGMNGRRDGPKTFPVAREEAAVKDLECIAPQQLNEAILFG